MGVDETTKNQLIQLTAEGDIYAKFESGKTPINVTYNVTFHPNWKSLNSNDFIVGFTSYNATINTTIAGNPWAGSNAGITKSYDNSTGILTISVSNGYADSGDGDYAVQCNNCFAFLIP